MKRIEKPERQKRLYHCPNVNQGTYVIWVFQERVRDCIWNQRWRAETGDEGHTSSVVICTILDPAHVPEAEKNGGQWCDTGDLVTGVSLLKQEKV